MNTNNENAANGRLAPVSGSVTVKIIGSVEGNYIKQEVLRKFFESGLDITVLEIDGAVECDSNQFDLSFLPQLDLPKPKSVHQIYLEIKELNLSDDDFKTRLKEEGVIVSKESLDRQHEIANRISQRITNNDR